ncbi:hypothetical protein ACWDO0_28230 [Nocardia rhamnosiphila]
MEDVLGVVRDIAERLEAGPPDPSPASALALAHVGLSAVTLGAAVLSGQTSSRTSELAAVNLAVVEAHTEIAEVIGDDQLDAASDKRVIELLSRPENLPRIRVSAKGLREALLRLVNAVRSVLAGVTSNTGLTAPLHRAIHQTGTIVEDILVLIDGPTHLRTALANAYYQRMLLDD